MGINLYDYQLEAVNNMFNGCILCGGVGSGKSITALSYYFINNGGKLGKKYVPMKNPKDLYIITTARKRDDLEWEKELCNFLLSTDEKINYYKNKVVIDSWNNIKKYVSAENAFFIFDEDRVIGNGTWSKTFIKIAKRNEWILLSATPGDTWMDYSAVFIANGFYKNITEFKREHIIYSYYTKYPKIDRYVNTGRLIRLRNKILVDMDYKKKTIAHHEDVYVDYDALKYKYVMQTRWDIFKDEPIQQASSLCIVLRQIINSDPSRIEAVIKILNKKKKAIIFYNFDYELEILKNADYGSKIEIAEWNGHKHQPLPESDNWIYLVQYNAGSEGWNCTRTNTIIFYSQNYSYRTLTQACGRIDRLTTPYRDLYYYHIKSHAGLEIAIARAIKNKKNFNESRFVNKKAA